MGKRSGRILIALLAATWGFAQIRHEVSVVNISVPVRVFDGEKFVDSLKLEDFEVYEDGKLQPVEAVYLIRGSEVQRQEGPAKAPAPATSRTFVLFFQLAEYLPEIDKAIDLFFESVYRPGDAVDIVTPQKTYRLRDRIDSRDKVRKAKSEVQSRVRKDVLVLSGAYRSVIEDILTDLGAGDPETAEVNLNGYRMDLERLEALRAIDSESMSAFAAELKGRPGAKHVFLFYQREKVPQFNNRKLIEFLNSSDPEQAFKVQELMAAYNREARIDREAIQRAFSDASVDVHFLYVTRNRRDPQTDVENPAILTDVKMAESSSPIYRVFKEIAAATGGTSAAAANPAALLRKAAAAAEQYYLLYYQPQGYRADGKFRKITVKVKGSGLRVSHREGYFAVDSSAPGEKAVSGPVEVGVGPAGNAGEKKDVAKAAGGLGAEIEDIDLTGAVPAKGGPVPDGILKAAARYCRDLKDASLDFVGREEVRERLSGALAAQASILKDTDPSNRGITVGNIRDLVREWAYDYQLVRREGWAAETRVLLEENGKARREENASLRTSRFEHKFVVLGPVGLFSDEAQRLHEYRIVGETDMEGEPVLVIDVRPTGTGRSSLYGKAWVRERDGALLKIEWEPGSMGNYAAIEEFAKASRAQPRIKFTSEYGFEKNGLRFPSAYEVIEAYRMSGRMVTLSRTNVEYKNYKFFEVKVRTEIRKGG
jgi:VWFA-related protein